MSRENRAPRRRISLTPKQIGFQQSCINMLLASGLRQVKYRPTAVRGGAAVGVTPFLFEGKREPERAEGADTGLSYAAVSLQIKAVPQAPPT